MNDTNTTQPLCRARRLLNPFRGVMHTLEAEQCDAATVDGIHWGLYIVDETVYKFIDLNSVAPLQSAEVKYGEWSPQEGLKRAPLLPTMNQERVESLGKGLLYMVERYSSGLPFELADHYERWLLDDETGEPLALLESAYEEREVNYSANTKWRIGQRALHELRLPGQGEDVARQLETAVNRRSRRGRNAWFLREQDGSGIRLPRPGEVSDGQTLIPGECFPRYGLSLQWSETELAMIAQGYIEWLSPWLVLTEEGGALEALLVHAVQYPDRLYRNRRLLGEEIRQRKEVKAALVSAKLDRSNPR